MNAPSSVYKFAELLVHFITSSRGRPAAFRPNNYMQVDSDVVMLIYELSARGYISKTRNSKGVRVTVPPDSPLYKMVLSACSDVPTQTCVKQVAEYLHKFI